MTIKEKVKSALPITGTHVNLLDPTVSDIFGVLGYDYIFVDMEHSAIDCEHVFQHILAAKANDMAVFVRVPADDTTITKRVLEMGIDGIIFPMIKDSKHAEEMIAQTLYPPYGKRGCGPKRAVKYGVASEPDYYKNGHLELCRFVMIELESAALDAENIAKNPFIDGCVMGFHDLSGSIGKLGDIFCEENLALATKAINAFKEEGKTVSISTYATDTETLTTYHNLGMNMISMGADYVHIVNGAKQALETLNKIRRQLL